MSLFTDLKDVLTPYAQRIKGLAAADEEIKADLANVGMSSAAKAALLDCFRNVAWANAQGRMYYDDLVVALNNTTYPQIRATFNAESHKIYNVFSANDVKQYISVKYYETKNSEGVTIPQNNFTVSGTLTSGDSVLRVEYQDYSTMLAISDVIDFYNVHHWNSKTDTDVAVILPRAATNVSYPGITENISTVGDAESPTRKSMWMKYGKSSAYYSDLTVSNYFAIPIPADATGIIVTITPSTYRFNTMFRVFDDSAPHLLISAGESGWQTGSYSRDDIPTHGTYGKANMIILNTQGVSGNFGQGNPVFDITFTTE